MKFLIVLALAAVAVQANLTAEQQWALFKVEHGKEYQNSVEERTRFAIFQDNLNKINEHNKLFEQGLSTFEMGVTQFTDLTEEEFISQLGLDQTIPHEPIGDDFYQMEEGEVLAASVDWRTKGAVTPVKNQASCGSCWAFSATGALEGQYQIKNNKQVLLSEQQLVDCSTAEGNMGCSGGLMTKAYDYIKKEGITTEAKYPYTAKNGKCSYKPADSVTKVSGYTNIPQDNEESLKSAVSKVGPVAVAIDATGKLQNYKSGILDDTTCRKTALNHGVLAVGYGNENGQDYWIVKNSWGESWGEKGYFKYPLGKNMCGIATMACYPKL